MIHTGRPADAKGSGLLSAAAFLLLLLATAQGYVSFRAQYSFVDHAKHARIPSLLEALGLDTGAIIFALLALSLARRGRRGTVERTLNVACALGSMIMNLLAANLTSPRSVTVWVLPSALYALASDRLIAVVRRWVLAINPSAAAELNGSSWRVIGGLTLWTLRLIFDTRGTLAGFRRWVLAAAPVAPGIPVRHSNPAVPGKLLISDEPEPAPGESKRAALIRLYERCGQTGDPRYGNRAKAAEIAGEIAGRIGYHPGTARRELVRYLAAQSTPQTSSQPEATPDPEVV